MKPATLVLDCLTVPGVPETTDGVDDPTGRGLTARGTTTEGKTANQQITENSEITETGTATVAANTTAGTATTKAHLLFLIDVTGSMGQWISALSSTLPSTLRSMSLTRSFETIGVSSYTDYDQPRDTICDFSGFCNTTDPEAVAKLQKFAASLFARGGGGTPEAVKTALLQLAEKRCDGKLFVIHLTDAPPHEVARLDTEGKKEFEALGAEKFDWIHVTEEFMKAFPSLRYTCLTSHPHPFFSYLSQTTLGSVYPLEGSVNVTNIRKQLGRVLNGLFGLGDAPDSQSAISTSEFSNEKELSATKCSTSTIPTPADPLLCSSLMRAVRMMKQDAEFASHATNEFEAIIRDDPMALTISPILGKMWRELCKKRSDPRRDELIVLLSQRKHSLSSADREVLEEWLKESYDCTAEIEYELKVFMGKKATKGLLRFLPEDDSLCAQQIVQLLASGTTKAIAMVRAILSRMYIDTEFELPVTVVAEDDEETPLPFPPRSIPLNMNSMFNLSMHIVAPGTKLTNRYTGMLCLHAIQCGSVLTPQAKQFLERLKGKWINWKRREDGSAEVPENWSIPFLDLILHPTCEDLLSLEELAQAKFLRKISQALRFYHNLEVLVKVVDAESLDGRFKDYSYNCPDCKKNRPRTLIASDGVCGLCKCGIHLPAMEDISYISVRCYSCGAIYSRNSSAYVCGHSKCHGCRSVGQAPPTSTCSRCSLKFVNYYKSEKGLPNGLCCTCFEGESTRVLKYIEYPALAHQVLGSHFVELCRTAGLEVNTETWVPNSSLCTAVLSIKEIAPEPLPEPPTEAFFRQTLPVQNIPEVWSYVSGVMAGSTIKLSECSICFAQDARLVPACGRRGCVQRICAMCCKAWYGKNAPGSLLYQRATLCQFCCRVPAPNVLARVDPRLVNLASHVSKNPLYPDYYYGWCSSCLSPIEITTRECAGGIPALSGYKCESCMNPRKPDMTVETKNCPSCHVTTMKTGGCNHMACTCGEHWCWECAQGCGSPEATYKHMWDEHGRIFADDGYVMDEEDDLT